MSIMKKVVINLIVDSRFSIFYCILITNSILTAIIYQLKVPRFKHATPHKLRHTGATLAKQAGTSIEIISEALTHSDTSTTKTYINTSNVVPIAMGEIAYRNLIKI
ncbi:site-specific integrase [Streptococcus sp. SS-4456]